MKNIFYTIIFFLSLNYSYSQSGSVTTKWTEDKIYFANGYLGNLPKVPSRENYLVYNCGRGIDRNVTYYYIVTYGCEKLSPTGVYNCDKLSNSSSINITTDSPGRVTVQHVRAETGQCQYPWTKTYNLGTTTFRIVDFNWKSNTPAELCVNASRINLHQYFTYNTNTSFSGRGVIDGHYFSPQEAGVNTNGWTITATNTFDNGTISRTVKIKVYPTYHEQTADLGNMWLIDKFELCQDANTIDLKEKVRYYKSDSDVFSWSGGSGTAFTAAAVGSGEFEINYKYKNSYGCSSDHKVSVEIGPSFSVEAGEDEAFCIDHDEVWLSGAGTWEGAGVVEDDFGIFKFNPELAGAGPHNIIYIEKQGVCTKRDDKRIYVYPKPSINAGADLQFCKESGIKLLNTAGVDPQNGNWSFADANSTFNDFIDNENKTLDISELGIGRYELTYSYTDNNGCSNQDIRTIDIKDVLSAPIVAEDNFSCGPGKILLSISEPQSGVGYNWYEDSADVSTMFLGTSYQTPTLTETQTYWISATNTSGCESPRRKVFAEVREIPSISAGQKQYTCYEGETITLKGGIPANGTYEGTQVVNNIFDPKGLPEGAYTVTYKAEVNGCQGFGTKEVIIRENYNVDAGADKYACFGDGNINLNDLNVFPSDGKWKFHNELLDFARDSNIVDVNQLQANSDGYLIEYSVTDTMGCKASDYKRLVVFPRPDKPEVTSKSKCGPGTQIFQVNNKILGSYRWYKDTISVTPFKTGESFITEYQQDSKIYNVTVTNGDGCTSEKTFFESTINPVPILNLPDEYLVCLNTTKVKLDSLVSPLGGTFTGTGVSGREFYPSIAGEGAYLIEYEIFNEFGCRTKEGFQLTVTGSLNGDIIGNDTSFCKSNPPIDLNTWTNLQGGFFYGPGVENNVFTPTQAPTNNQNKLSITYEYEENGCTFKDTRNITLLTSPSNPSIQGDSIGCLGDILEFSSPKVSNLKYNWFLDNDQTVFSTDQNINVKVGDVKTVKLVVENQIGCPSAEPGIVIIGTRNPSGTISTTETLLEKGDYTQFSFSGKYADSFEWNFGDGDYSLEEAPYHYYYDLDTFDVSVIVTSELGCKDTFEVKELIIVEGKELEYPLDTEDDPIFTRVKNLGLITYPNPATDFINLKFGKSGEYVISISNLTGEVLKSEEVKGRSYKADLSGLNSGLYLLQIKGDLNHTIKIEKQ